MYHEYPGYEYEMLCAKHDLRPVRIVGSYEYLNLVDPTNTITFSLSIQDGGFKIYIREDGVYEIPRYYDMSMFKSRFVGFIRSNVIVIGHDSTYEKIDKIMSELNRYELGTPRFMIQVDMKIFIKMNFNKN